MSKTETIKFEIGSGVLSRYKNLNYTVWYAIAEFVDNSLHSYKNNKKELDEVLIKEKQKPKIKIAYDKDAKTLRIIDNFMGMDIKELKSSMNLGKPADKSDYQLSQFGMGMKTASFWLGNILHISTTKLNDENQYDLEINLNELVSGNLILNPRVSKAKKSEHKTIIEVRELTRVIKGRSAGKVADTLESMYREFIKTDEVEIWWKVQKLKWRTEKLRKSDTDKKDIKKEFEFEINGLNVKGWAGIMDEGKGSRAGLDVIRFGRLIMGYPESNWKPDEIYGASGGMVTQRLIGEIFMDDFQVTHTKDNIDWDESNVNYEEFVQKLKDEIAELKSVAAKPRKGKGEPPAKPVIDETVKILESHEYESVIEDIELIEDDKTIKENNNEIVTNTISNSEPILSSTATLHGGNTSLTTKVYTENNGPHAPYLVLDYNTEPNTTVIIINTDHVYYNNLETDYSMTEFIKNCVYDGIAEHRASKKNNHDPATFREIKNQLLKLDYEIERND